MIRVALALTIASTVQLTGCLSIMLLSAPETVAIGDTATFVLDISASDSGANANPYVVAEVPASWTLQSATYTGIINGSPASGSGTIVAPAFGGCMPDPRPEFQILWITDGPFNTAAGDSAEVTLDFAVNGLPAGEIATRFWFLALSDTGGGCNPNPAVATINRSPRRLHYEQTIVAGSLPLNRSLILGPDGSPLIIGGGPYVEATLYERNPITGDLTWIEPSNQPGISDFHDLVVSPDGRHVYGVDNGTDQLAAFELGDPPDALVPIQSLFDNAGGVDGLNGPRNLTISPDGSSVYVSATDENKVSVFSRDGASGLLTFVEYQQDFTAGLHSPRGLAVGPDGLNLYVTGWDGDALLVYDRDPATGRLTFLETHENGTGATTGLESPRSLALSRDGSNVYVLAKSTIAVFSREPSTGALTFQHAMLESGTGGPGLRNPWSIGISSDDRTIVVAGQGTLAVYARDPSGLLSQVETHFAYDAGVPKLDGPSGLMVSADNADVYYGGDTAIALFSWRLLGDDFESGTTAAWASTVP